MQRSDEFSTYHNELLDGRYDCIDRIVLNGYFPLRQQGGGFRFWWRQLTGSDDTLDQDHLLRMAGRFSRRVHGWAKKSNIPILHCAPGEQKHELAEAHLPQDPNFQGIFLILVAKAPGLVWDVKCSDNGSLHIQRKTPWPYVNHYHFHINVVHAADHSYLPDGTLNALAEPTQRGTRRLAGVDLQKPRVRAVSEAILALAPKPGGFTMAELAHKVRNSLSNGNVTYTSRHAAYDFSKLRGKKLVERIGKSRRYRAPPDGIRILAGMFILREKVIKPVLAGLGKPRIGRPPKNVQPIDQHYNNLQHELRRTFETLALAT
uniref:Uncharacterized protein n=1 Tax=Candidatus Kentrum sp. LFY TaxID=2126342 RepID=A0A450WDG8_9GAMM|nr:MAG: hypothetical protein BECKLFY1418C_GA0070996_101250 [Candidatus Kentron sp. LFY]